MNEITKETSDKWDIFFVEKEKKEELKRPKAFRVYQKDKDKGKGKVGGPPSIKVTDNLPPPPSDAPPVETIGTPPVIDNVESMQTTHEDINPDLEVLYTMNIDTQEVNIVVDKETTEKKDVATEPLVENIVVETYIEDRFENVEIGIETHTEQSNDPLDTRKIDTTDLHTEKPIELEKLATDNTVKSIEIPTVDSSEVHIEKPIENTETSSKKPIEDSTEKHTEVHSEKHEEKKVEIETVPPATAEKPKPFLVEI